MKLIVQIPCLNEAATLPQTVRDIPRHIDGIDEIEILIIDDGSTDGTAEVARELGVDHIVRHRQNVGLARSFETGIAACLRLGADLIVNTDGDNQYKGAYISELVAPLLDGSSDMTIGDRQTSDHAEFSITKRFLQRQGSAAVRVLSGLDLPDAVSGFRGYTRDAAFRLNIVTDFSYTIESLILAGRSGMAVTSVPVEVNAKTRESRLFRNIPQFVSRQLVTMVRSYTMYRPLKAFTTLAVIAMLLGLFPIVRFLIAFLQGDGDGRVQSLVVGSALVLAGYMTLVFGLLAEIVASNRRLLESTLEKIKRLELREPVRTR